MENINEILRKLPSVDKVFQEKTFEGLNSTLLKHACREVFDRLRADIKNGSAGDFDTDSIYNDILTEYRALEKGTLVKVINATGVTVHTNLGRAPLSEDFAAEAVKLASGYTNLEYDLTKGKRGDRYHHVSGYIKMLTGAEDALVVNNNASAVFIILNTLCRNKEAVVSRGELVEIGGSFRVPDVMAQSGAKLKEVGTTNKTRIQDYKDAVTAKTAMMVKVHKSNFDIVGFSEEAPGKDVAKAAAESGVISYYDAGSGLFEKLLSENICPDNTVPEIIQSGFDLVSFSGDKMLGGPQAGIIAGKKELIAKIRKNQLMRMLRVDKLTLAILQQVMRSYLTGEWKNIPVNRMLGADTKTLRGKAEYLASKLPCKAEVVSTKASVGGGSCPMSEIDSFGTAIEIKGKKPQTVDRMLRNSSTPVIARVGENVIFDVFTLTDKDIETVIKAVEELV